MSALVVLIPVSLALGLIGLGAYFWAMRHGQFDDPEGNASRVLTPDTPLPPSTGDADGRLASHPRHRNPAGRL